MEIRIPVLVQDQLVARGKGFEPTEKVKLEETFFLDGPVSRRVAVLDFDEQGGLRSGARFVPPRGDKPGTYEVSEHEIDSDAFIQVNAFGTVYATMAMFEEDDALGRELTWAFDAPHLLVVPRAGHAVNAYYERDSHSLQFFTFPSARERYHERTVLTSLARDIVAHEAGHAILDGIAPDLYNAITPQSLALHEAIADLTALLMALRSRTLVNKVLEQTGGSIERSTAFSSIAEEFGALRAGGGPLQPLRSLLNSKVLPRQGSPDRSSPHALSEVLTGGLYTVLVEMHVRERDRLAEQQGQSAFSASGKALFVVREHFKRMIVRALDYLPPGEVSFADYGRAIIAADRASHPGRSRERRSIAEQFVKRGIVSSTDELLGETAHGNAVAVLDEALAEVDLQALVSSDWVAYDFANQMRGALRIPEDRPFRVRRRLDATKKYRDEEGGWKKVRECIFKVSWDHEEANPRGFGFPARRQITLGTTLAIHWPKPGEGSPTVRTLLSSDEADEHRADRSAMLNRLRSEDRLKVGHEAVGPDGQQLGSAVLAEASGDLLRIRKSARMLHIDALDDEEAS